MRAQAKVIDFMADVHVWGYNFCSYCPATNYFGMANSVGEVVADVQSHLLRLLCYREVYKNLANLGWEFTDISIKVPTFTDEEAVRLTEQFYSTTIVEPKIIVVDVEVPIIPKF